PAPPASTPRAWTWPTAGASPRRDGDQQHRLVEQLGVPLVRGRIDTQADMAVPGLPGIWALGDCAQVANAASGADSPPPSPARRRAPSPTSRKE
ncbi:hypothetical protein V2S84_15570, partial [Azotobacter chroococcum]|nr:hypothetical protein [Azotobacter chroococcum]